MNGNFYQLNLRFDLFDEHQREVRHIIREELQEMAFISEPSAKVQAASPVLTEEEQAENTQSVLDDLEMFG